MKIKVISKSSFISGRECHLKLWNLLWNRDNAGKRSGIDELRMQFGVRFGELAHGLYPDATLIDINPENNPYAEHASDRAAEGKGLWLRGTACEWVLELVAQLSRVRAALDGSSAPDTVHVP